jgi:hypothetical protein
MSGDGNTWAQLWEEVVAGKGLEGLGLFDPVEQTEFAIDYLRGLTPLELIGDLVPVALAAAYYAAEALVRPDIAAAKEALVEIERAIDMFHLNVEVPPGTLPPVEYRRIALEVADGIERAAFQIVCQNSLLKKLSGCAAAINKLSSPEGFRVSDETERKAVVDMFRDMEIDFESHALTREFFFTGEIETETRLRIPQHLYVGDFRVSSVIASIVREQCQG